jgi:phosphoenolpyruvate carboxykinase (ATP)
MMSKHEARCVLLNTGWSGGPYGVGKRISIKDTRALLNAALRGDLHAPSMTYTTHPVFGMKVPTSCPGVDPKVLDPRGIWSDGAAYDAAAQKLRDMFRKNFEEKNFGALGIEPVM